jgi:hypothetical protein
MAEATATGFPEENIDPKKKQEGEEGRLWHLQTAKAIWYFTHKYSPNLLYKNRSEEEELIQFAFGAQSEDLTKPALGINPENAAHSHIGGINWETKKFAIKRVKTTASKIFNKQYDPIATAIDPTSSDRRLSVKASIKMLMEHSKWMNEIEGMMAELPEGIDMDNLPINDDDLNQFMQNDFKLNEEIILELGITYHLNRLDFDEIKKKADWYLTVLPVAGVWTGLDANDLPEIKTLNPKKIIAPYSEFEDYRRMLYCGYMDEYTVPEFRKMVGNSLPRTDVDNIIKLHARRGNYTISDRQYDSEKDRNVDKIWVMHFETRQTDEYTMLEKPDEGGNMRLHEKPFDYYRKQGSDAAGNPYPTEEDFKKEYGDTRKIHRFQKPTVYAGYWVVDTDFVFRWGEQNYCKGELGYKLRASNMVDGHATSMVMQMVPCIKAIERYDKKIQSIVASTLHQAIKIDLAALRKVQYKIGGQNASFEQLVEMFIQRGIILVDTSDQAAGSTNSHPIEVINAGVSKDIVTYIELMKFELEQMDEIIGYNKASAGSTLSPETGARVAQGMELQTETALDHLYQASRGLCRDLYSTLAHLHRVSVQRRPDYYVPVLGESAVSRILMSQPYTDYGIDIETRQTSREWDDFMADVDGMVKSGQLKMEDKAAIKRFQNLKQAHSYLKTITRKREKDAQAFELQKIQQVTEQQNSSAMLASQEAFKLEQFRRETEVGLKTIEAKMEERKHRYKMEELELQVSLQNEGKWTDTEIEGNYSLQEAKIKSKEKLVRKEA